jgi:hypothetical protein
VSRGTQDPATSSHPSPTGLSPSLMLLSNSFGLGLIWCPRSYNPDLAEARLVWATSHFARHYSGNLG